MSDNVYYQAEKFGLVQLGELELSEPCYSFDLFVMWHHPEFGRYYWASDSGCSCPEPFGAYEGLSDLESGDRVAALAALSSATARPIHDSPQVVADLRERILGVTS